MCAGQRTSRPASANMVGSPSGMPGSPRPRSAAVDLPAARKAHLDAAEQLAHWTEECLALDQQAEAVDSEQQQLLVSRDINYRTWSKPHMVRVVQCEG